MFATSSHPSGSILAANNSVKCVLLPFNTRIPIVYTISLASAVSVGATTLSVASITPSPGVQNPLILENGCLLQFAEKTIVVQNDSPSQHFQKITTGGSTTIKVLPVTSENTLSIVDRLQTLALQELLGIENIEYDSSSTLNSIRSQKSKLGSEQRLTQINSEFQVAGWVNRNDNCYKNIIKLASDKGLELYLQAELSDGRIITGAFGVANLTNSITIGDIVKATFTLFGQGNLKETYGQSLINPSPTTPTLTVLSTTNTSSSTVTYTGTVGDQFKFNPINGESLPAVMYIFLAGNQRAQVDFTTRYLVQPFEYVANGQNYQSTFTEGVRNL